MKRCPRCQAALAAVQIGPIQVEGCSACGGVWFDNTELGHIANADSGDLLALEDQFLPGAAAASAPVAMACPTCHAALFEFEFAHSPGVKLDACPQCKGIWADDGELQALYARMAGAASAPPAPGADVRRAGRQAMGLLSRRSCPNCGRANPASGLTCLACAARLPQASGSLCPNCDTALQYRSFRSLRLDVCADCTGVWLDAGELSAIAECRPEALQQVQDDAAAKRQGVSSMWKDDPILLCPRCCIRMTEQESPMASGVRLDVCERCNGLWAGAGKLAALSRHYTHSLNQRRRF